MKLGMFDPPGIQPYVTEFTPDMVNTTDHQVSYFINKAR